MRGKTYSILLFAGILASLLPNVAIAGSREYINDWVYEASGAATCVAVSSNGSYIAVGTPYGLYLLDSDKNLLWNHQTDYPIIDISMTADASKIVAGGSSGYFGGGMAYFFNLAGDPKGTTKANHGLSSVSLSPEGDYFAITYDNGLGIADDVALYGYNEGKWLWYDSCGGGSSGDTDVSLSADGDYVALGAPTYYGYDKLWILTKSGGSLWSYKIYTSGVSYKYSVSISSDGKYIAAGNEDNDNLYFFERDQGFLWNCNVGHVKGVGISGDGTYVAAASSSKVCVFDRYKNPLWESQINDIEDVAISADANTIVVSTDDGKVYKFSARRSQPVKGVDVSAYQNETTISETGHDINWSDVYNDGYRFAFIKATEGEGWTGDSNARDPYFAENIKKARSAGLLVGAYHFGIPQLNKNPNVEAYWFLEVASKYLKLGDIRPVFDLEKHEPTGTHPSSIGEPNLTNWILTWMYIVEQGIGEEPILYTTRDYAKNLDTNVVNPFGKKITDYDLWIAHPTCDPTITPGTPDIGKLWGTWAFWQYWDPAECGNHSVPGISGGVDLDIFNGDMLKLEAFKIRALKFRIVFHLCSPADMVITDPDGLIISKDLNQILGATYEEVDIDGDGDLEDQVIIPRRKMGKYLIDVIPEPNVSPTDTYSLKVTSNGQTMILAQDVPIQDIPSHPYEFESKLNPSDFDNDGNVDFSDYAAFALRWMGADCHYPDWCEGRDLDYSGRVDFMDLSIFTENWLWEKIVADINIDGDVDFTDYAVLASHWSGQSCAESAWCNGADLNKSGSVDLFDLAEFAEHWLEGK